MRVVTRAGRSELRDEAERRFILKIRRTSLYRISCEV